MRVFLLLVSIKLLSKERIDVKAVQIIEPGMLHIIEVHNPTIDKKNTVLIKMTAAGICGSDIAIYHGTNAAAT